MKSQKKYDDKIHNPVRIYLDKTGSTFDSLLYLYIHCQPKKNATTEGKEQVKQLFFGKHC